MERRTQRRNNYYIRILKLEYINIKVDNLLIFSSYDGKFSRIGAFSLCDNNLCYFGH